MPSASLKSFKYHGTVSGVDALAAELDRQPDLWNERPARTQLAAFRGTDDIWLRWRNEAELTSPEAYLEPHYPVFYPPWYKLKAAHSIVKALVERFRPGFVGGILITRIPAGESVKPHKDGGWHAHYCNAKFYVPLRANDRCVNHAEGGQRVVMREREVWAFDNTVTHWVENDGEEERISLIVCMKTAEEVL